MFDRDDLLARMIRGTLAGAAVLAIVFLLAASTRPIGVAHAASLLSPAHDITALQPAGSKH